jgi:hypothetical protein
MWPEELELVYLPALIPTQYPAYSPCGMAKKRLGEPPRDGQHWPLIVEVEGLQYIYDSHHRTALKLREGIMFGWARVLRK